MGTKTPDAPHCKPVSPSTPWCWDVDLGRQSQHRGQTTVARRRGVTPGVRNAAHHCAPWKCRSGAAGFCPPPGGFPRDASALSGLGSHQARDTVSRS